MSDLSIFNDLESHFNSYNSTDTKSVSTLAEVLSYYKNCIKEFFSQNGEANGIREMYKAIREIISNGNDKLISCIDISQSYHIYQEYLDGMSKFISEIKDSNCCMDDSTLTVFQNNLEKGAFPYCFLEVSLVKSDLSTLERS